MLNPSARNSRFTRSWIGNFLLTCISKFQYPGPRKEFRATILLGNGPQSEMPFGKFVRSGLVGPQSAVRGVSGGAQAAAGGKRFGFPHEFGSGSDPIAYEFVPPPDTPLGIDLNVCFVIA